jgi:AraC-like DNA-binding protein
MATISILSTLALLSAATGIFFSFVFLSIKGNKSLANRMLSLLLFLFSIRIAEIAFYWTTFVLDFPHIFDISSPMPFLFGVSIFFYVKLSLNDGEKLNYTFLYHLIPFILYTIYLMPFYMQSADSKIAELTNITSTNPVFGTEFYTFRTIKLLHMTAYAVLTGALINSVKIKDLNKQQRIEIKWYKYLVIGFVVFIAITGLQTFGIAVSGYKYIIELDSALMITCAFMIYSSIYFTVKNPDIFIGTFRKLPILKYNRSSLTDEKAEIYSGKIIELMQTEKIYLNPDLKLSDLSKKLSIPVHHISQVINDNLKLGFSDFINKYRIDEAKKLLKDPEYDKFTILSVGYEVGFKNKASFNSAFKKFTKITPSVFKKQYFTPKSKNL